MLSFKNSMIFFFSSLECHVYSDPQTCYYYASLTMPFVGVDNKIDKLKHRLGKSLSVKPQFKIDWSK